MCRGSCCARQCGKACPVGHESSRHTVCTLLSPDRDDVGHAGFQTPQSSHASVGGQGLSSVPSFVQHEPFSPGVATPVLFGGPRAPAHAHKPSVGDADMWDGSDERDAGAEMFSNLSVSCCMSPTGKHLGAGMTGADLCDTCHQSAADHSDLGIPPPFNCCMMIETACASFLARHVTPAVCL